MDPWTSAWKPEMSGRVWRRMADLNMTAEIRLSASFTVKYTWPEGAWFTSAISPVTHTSLRTGSSATRSRMYETSSPMRKKWAPIGAEVALAMRLRHPDHSLAASTSSNDAG